MSLVQFHKDFIQNLKHSFIPLIYQNDLKKLGAFYGTQKTHE